jgi:hypothetical protein
VLFVRVPEDEVKTVKNRVHLDLRPTDQAAEAARIESLGGRRVCIGQGDAVPWIVMADPEGNALTRSRSRNRTSTERTIVLNMHP